MSEARGGLGVSSDGVGDRGVDGNGFDPSNLHLRKELTQIRKAARLLRDPGTSSSWRSPLSPARSSAISGHSPATVNHYYYHFVNGNGVHNHDNLNGTGDKSLVLYTHVSQLGESNGGGGGREKKVLLYNWPLQNSESERSATRRQSHRHEQKCEDDIDYDGGGSSSVMEESVEDSTSDARHGGNESKSDTCKIRRYDSMIFKCKEENLTPTISRTIKKKSKKNAHSAHVSSHRQQQLTKKIAPNRSSKRVLQRMCRRDALTSLIDQSDDTEACCNSEEFRRGLTFSPLLARIRHKHKKWSPPSSKLLGSSKKEESSYSYNNPALSSSSCNRYEKRNRITCGSWDVTTASFNGDDGMDGQLDLPGRRGCGIPCYWSRRSTPKYRGGSGSCCSHSISDPLSRERSILWGNQRKYHKRRSCGSALVSNKNKLALRTTQGLIPMLTNCVDGRDDSSIGTGNIDDELSTNFVELDLEALSRLDGRRWSAGCRSRGGLELVALTGKVEGGSTPDNNRSLSQKYRPMFFEELIGQNMVVESLRNAISRERIAPVHFFLGPRGTGKTITARIFAAALNCLATPEIRPCGVCWECTDFVSGKSRHFGEFDGSNKKGVERMRYLLKNLSVSTLMTSSHYKVFVIDDCHLLPSKTWRAFFKILQKPPPFVVFIFTTDLDNVPRTVLSRCQKYLFSKIKDSDIVIRLRKIASDENLDAESDALDLIAMNALGSLRDAETMLDQLSLLGKRITTSLVNELIGVISNGKLLELLELAMSSDTAETIKRARELMDSGVDPMVLMSQLATLIMDIIAGTYQIVDPKYRDTIFGVRSLTEAELGRLKHALKLLSEAKKQLMVSSECSTWLTATLLHLSSPPSPDPAQSGSSMRWSSKATEDDQSTILKEFNAQKQRPHVHYAPRKSTSSASLPNAAHQNLISQQSPFSRTNGVSFSSNTSHHRLSNDNELDISHDDSVVGNTIVRCLESNSLDDIWEQCIERCHSKTLRQFLHTYGKLVSISEIDGVFVTYIAFDDGDKKMRAERFLSSLTNSFEIVLRCNVEVRIILLSDDETSRICGKPTAFGDCFGQNQRDESNMLNMNKNAIDSNLDLDSHQDPDTTLQASFKDSEGKLVRTIVPTAVNGKVTASEEVQSEIPLQRTESIIHEQLLETAWLQTAEESNLEPSTHLKLERNRVLSHNSLYNNMESTNTMDLAPQHWEDQVNHEIKISKTDDGKASKKDDAGKRVDHYSISPSLLHKGNTVGNVSERSMGYDSGPAAGGCSGLFCWCNGSRRRKKQIKQGIPVRSQKARRVKCRRDSAKS